ncbi:hypothetical protein CVT26_000644 [Gymnopilus dilepis]|uniref:Auxin efflux carrier n=1 Tax=Gymnopilus dilepis TaxID=231916 RepID=A0A409Y2S2_9AGAR|nr:hypothetical protein CVT26_000644 [Gymnopilus dilepis]
MDAVQHTFYAASTSHNAYTNTTTLSANAATIAEAAATTIAAAATTTGPSATPFGRLLLAVFNSILEVFLLCAAGYILARNGILDKRTQKQINRLNVSLFTPALLFSKVAFFLTPEKLRELWIVPVWFVIVTSASMAVGRAMGWMFRLPKSQRSFVMAAAMFMNSNALPIALMQSLVLSVPDLAWGEDDNTNAMMGRALTYLTMYSTLGMVVRYSYGVSLLSRADTINAEPAHHPPPPPHFSSTHLQEPSTASSSAFKYTDSPDALGTSLPLPPTNTAPSSSRPPMTNALLHRPLAQHHNTSFYNSFPNSPNDSRANLPEWVSEAGGSEGLGYGVGSSGSSEDGEAMEEGGEEECTAIGVEEAERDLEAGVGAPRRKRRRHHTHTHASPTAHRDPSSASHRSHPKSLLHPLNLRHLTHKLTHRLHRLLITIHNFMTVPLWAALASLLVACLEPLKHALENHLQPLNEAVNTCGKCAVPLTLVVLGAYFCEEEEGEEGGKKSFVKRVKGAFARMFGKHKAEEGTEAPNGHANATAAQLLKKTTQANAARPGESRTVVLAIMARMIVTPLLLVPLILSATYGDWHAVFDE